MFTFDGPLLKQSGKMIGLVNCSKENREWMLRALNNYDKVVTSLRDIAYVEHHIHDDDAIHFMEVAKGTLEEIGADEATN